jgi:hypothetical protein
LLIILFAGLYANFVRHTVVAVASEVGLGFSPGTQGKQKTGWIANDLALGVPWGMPSYCVPAQQIDSSDTVQILSSP